MNYSLLQKFNRGKDGGDFVGNAQATSTQGIYQKPIIKNTINTHHLYQNNNNSDLEENDSSESQSENSLLPHQQAHNIQNNLNFFPNPQSILKDKNEQYNRNDSSPNNRYSQESSSECSDDCINKSDILNKAQTIKKIEPFEFCQCNKKKKAEYMFTNRKNEAYCKNCALELLFKDKDAELLLNQDELKRRADICKFMDKVNELNTNLPCIIEGLNGKINEISTWYQTQLGKLNRDFQVLQKGLEEEHSSFISNLRVQYSEKQAYILDYVNHLNRYQSDIKQFTTDITKNFVSIVKNMELEPFYEILSNYYNQVGEIQKSIDYLKEDMIKLVKIKTDKNSLENYRKGYRNLYQNKNIFLSLCDLKQYANNDTDMVHMKGSKPKYSFQQTSLPFKHSLHQKNPNKDLSALDKKLNSNDFSTHNNNNNNNKSVGPSTINNPKISNLRNLNFMFDDELKQEAQKLIQTIDSFVGNGDDKNSRNNEPDKKHVIISIKDNLNEDDESKKLSIYNPEEETVCDPREINMDYFEKIQISQTSNAENISTNVQKYKIGQVNSTTSTNTPNHINTNSNSNYLHNLNNNYAIPARTSLDGKSIEKFKRALMESPKRLVRKPVKKIEESKNENLIKLPVKPVVIKHQNSNITASNIANNNSIVNSNANGNGVGGKPMPSVYTSIITNSKNNLKTSAQDKLKIQPKSIFPQSRAQTGIFTNPGNSELLKKIQAKQHPTTAQQQFIDKKITSINQQHITMKIESYKNAIKQKDQEIVWEI